MVHYIRSPAVPSVYENLAGITVEEVPVVRRAPILGAFAAERGSMDAFGLSADAPLEHFAGVAFLRRSCRREDLMSARMHKLDRGRTDAA